MFAVHQDEDGDMAGNTCSGRTLRTSYGRHVGLHHLHLLVLAGRSVAKRLQGRLNRRMGKGDDLDRGWGCPSCSHGQQ